MIEIHLVNFMFNNSNNEYIDEQELQKKRNMYYIVSLIILILSSVAAYLSWSCNTRSNQGFLVKIVCAINAFYFGILYIAFYYGSGFDKQCKQFYLVDTNINSECAKKIEAEILSSTSPEVSPTSTSNATSTSTTP